ncbi:MAG: hypothetical protein A3K06_00930 [Candidatus Doudnabacteria bacterium RIFCSPHIGHO2_01_52_17]|uniref:Uncharacterized protein n=1 Tax=Candidatus Doudnabacteria bacterium RIFCSPHIGHO2_01_52_17 TaxID=1817820 RepID=A0A1F5NEY4_9BACT|nr:MAG: hypothetical protein UY73_C0002G0002 [Parcubacteria group bacterium GW2011_GWA2_52_8]OGE76124.1 MAG: hypothetical protein A3K06_00930 [Candidatus Doudnabacteria bacterium RIFCSPHIGHO2_01_52_17]
MSKLYKILIVILLVAVAGVFLYYQFRAPEAPDQNLEEMKTSIVAPPVVSATNLSEQDKQKYLDRFEEQKKIAFDSNFDNLQNINELGMLKKVLGDLDGARVAWEYAGIIRPGNSLTFANLAAMYHYDLRQLDRAEENYLITIQNDPDDISTIRNFFELYVYDFKDGARAEGLIMDAIAKNQESPILPDLYTLLGSFYLDTGRINLAIEYYQKHLDLNPDNEAVKKEIERLRALPQ